ncbi:hypothetical protein [Limosilactobacillus reuteri]|uniref:hypothetical protein n=1 Tax=Limosilactobacillus reuteri TaxID=1598 RepID=UPI00128C2CC5|nr:hypothetical protein [Limosilactobacillus reuteri]MQB69413.1 hypothetical protein [Limosilactobacillus reuteri]MQC04760.1 hypothetical protein [Limosilactobacillus reuteri]
MKSYKEIRQWLYLETQGIHKGDVYFNIVYVLAILNGTPESIAFKSVETMALSMSRLKKEIKKAGTLIKTVPVNNIEFIKNANGETIDKHSAGIVDEGVEIISSTNLLNLLQFENKKRKRNQTKQNYPYQYITFGEIERKSDGNVFLSLLRTQYDIKGYGYPNGLLEKPSEPITPPSLNVLREKAKLIAQDDDQIIKIGPNEIAFGLRTNRPKHAELYLSPSLHDQLYNYYLSGQKYDLSNRKKSIDEIVKSTPKVTDYTIHNNLTDTWDMSSDDIAAMNNKLKRDVKNIAAQAKKIIKSVSDSEVHSKHELIEAQRRLASIRSLVKKAKEQNQIDSSIADQIDHLSNQY